MPAETISPIVIVAAALGFMALERRYPYTTGQLAFRPGFWLDLVSYGLLQSWVLGIVITRVVKALADAAGPLSWSIADWPVPLQLLVFLVTHDFYIYWFHRLQHSNAFLWRVHEAHHSVEHVDWVAGSRSHSLEILINQTIEFIPIALFGSPEAAVWKATLDAVWGMWIHSNIDARTGALQYLINGPEMHRWHHAVELPAPGRNFSTKIAIWDWIFGTAHHPKGEKPKGFGLGEGLNYPSGYFAQHIFAFRPLEDAAESDARVGG